MMMIVLLLRVILFILLPMMKKVLVLLRVFHLPLGAVVGHRIKTIDPVGISPAGQVIDIIVKMMGAGGATRNQDLVIKLHWCEIRMIGGSKQHVAIGRLEDVTAEIARSYMSSCKLFKCLSRCGKCLNTVLQSFSSAFEPAKEFLSSVNVTW